MERHETETAFHMWSLRSHHATSSWDGLFLAQLGFFRDENRKKYVRAGLGEMVTKKGE